MTLFCKMLLPNRLLWAGLVLLTGTCGDSGSNDRLRPYYFPLEKLRTGLVYEYRAVGNDTLAPQYIHYQTIEQDGRTFLIGHSYDYEMRPQQWSREEMVSDGMLLVESFIYQADTSGQPVRIPLDISFGSIFPFDDHGPEMVYVYHVKWNEPADTNIFTRLVRNRRIVGDTIFQYKNQSLPCKKATLRELVENYDEGYIEHEFPGIELYAKGIGLVYYRKNVTAGFALEYALYDTYSMSELERKLKVSDNPTSNDLK